jgi:hypothetical protein
MRTPVPIIGQRPNEAVLSANLGWETGLWEALQHLSLAPFNLHKTRVRRASGFLLTAFSNARPNPLFRSTLITKGAPPKKH